MRLETLLSIYDALLSDERVALDSLAFLEELLSTQQGGDGTVIVYARRLCRQAEDALKQDDFSTMLASLLSLRFYMCNAEHEQFWKMHLSEDGRKALWSGQSVGGLHQLPSTPEDVLETIFCTAVTYQLTRDLGLENPDQLVHALEHHRYASDSPQTSGALEEAMLAVRASVSAALNEEPGATQAGDTIATLSGPFAIQEGRKQELLKESWRNQDALGMKTDSSWREQGKSLVALIHARLPPPYLELLQDLPKPQAFAAAHEGMCPPNAPTFAPHHTNAPNTAHHHINAPPTAPANALTLAPQIIPTNSPTFAPHSNPTTHGGEGSSSSLHAACAACTAQAAQETALRTAAPATAAAASANPLPSHHYQQQHAPNLAPSTRALLPNPPVHKQQQQQQHQQWQPQHQQQQQHHQQQKQHQNGYRDSTRSQQTHSGKAHTLGGVAPNAASGGEHSSGAPHGSGPSSSLRHALSPEQRKQREHQNELFALEKRRKGHGRTHFPHSSWSAPPSSNEMVPSSAHMHLHASASAEASRGIRAEVQAQQQQPQQPLQQQQQQQWQQASGPGSAAPAGSIHRGGTAVAEMPEQGTRGASGAGREAGNSNEGVGGGETTMAATGGAAGGVGVSGGAGGAAALPEGIPGPGGHRGGQAPSASTREASRRWGTKRAQEREEGGVAAPAAGAAAAAAAAALSQPQEQQVQQQKDKPGHERARKRVRRERGGVAEGATVGVMGGVVVGSSGHVGGQSGAPEGRSGQESYSSSPHSVWVPDGPCGQMVAANDRLQQMAQTQATLEEIQQLAEEAGSPAHRACTTPSRSAHAHRRGGVQESPHNAPLARPASPPLDPLAFTDGRAAAEAGAAGAGAGGLQAANSKQPRRASGSRELLNGRGTGRNTAGVLGREGGGGGGEEAGAEEGWEDRPSLQAATGGGAQADPGRGLQGNGVGTGPLSTAEIAVGAVGGRVVRAPAQVPQPRKLTGPGQRLGAGMYTTRQWGDSPDPEPRLAQGVRNSRGADAEGEADEVEFTEMGIQDGQLADARQRALRSLPQPPFRRSGAGGAQERRTKRPWSHAEEVMLVKLMCKFKRRWAAILEEDRNLYYGARLLRDRDQVSLKDKFRNLERAGYVTPEFLDWMKREDTFGEFKGQALYPRD